MDPLTNNIFVKSADGNVISVLNLDYLVARSIKSVTITEEGQTVVVNANKTIVRFNSVFAGCRIQPALNNGDELVLLNNATTELGYNIDMRVVLQDGAEADLFTVAPNKNHLFWFDINIGRWIDVSL